MTIRLAVLICVACVCHAELQRIDTIKTESFGTDYQIVTGTAHFALDPRLPANKSIVDLVLAPRNSRGLVEATADLVIIQPRDPARANGTVLFEVSNRGGFSVLNVFNASANGSMQAGNEFLMRRGYTVAWLGWQFGLAPTAKFRIDVPKARVKGTDRWYAFAQSGSTLPLNQPGGYCASTSSKASARLYTSTTLRGARQLVPPAKWDLPDPCTIRIEGGFRADSLYELIYEAQDPPVAGIGLAAVRDFISWMKRKNTPRAMRAIGYGYSQSARFPPRVSIRRVQRGRAGADCFRRAAACSRRGGTRQFQSPVCRPRHRRQLN